MTENKRRVHSLLKSIETGDPGPVSFIDPTKYIQHNLMAADGLEGFGALMSQLTPGSARVNTVRVFEDGDHVFAHTEYDFFGPKIGFDILRFERGLIVEHWDNLQPTPTRANPSGRSMTDGPTQATDHGQTGANKALVRSFTEDVVIAGRWDSSPSYFDNGACLQHSPDIADGVANISAAWQSSGSKGGPAIRRQRLHKVLGEGNFVLTLIEGHVGEQHSSFYDLYRLDKGKIVEHWDTIESIPARAEWKNSNGKF